MVINRASVEKLFHRFHSLKIWKNEAEVFFKRQVLSGSDRGGMFENQVLLWNECQVLREGAGAYQSHV